MLKQVTSESDSKKLALQNIIESKCSNYRYPSSFQIGAANLIDKGGGC